MKKRFLFFVILLTFILNQAETREESENIQKTLYIYRPLINGSDLHHWAQEQGLTILSEDMLHVTLAYSRGGMENLSRVVDVDSNYFCNSDPEYYRYLDFFGKEKSVLVLKLNAPQLVERWGELTDAGAKWDWPDFQPHITLTYEAKEIDLTQITPYYGDLIFGPEVWIDL